MHNAVARHAPRPHPARSPASIPPPRRSSPGLHTGHDPTGYRTVPRPAPVSSPGELRPLPAPCEINFTRAEPRARKPPGFRELQPTWITSGFDQTRRNSTRALRAQGTAGTRLHPRRAMGPLLPQRAGADGAGEKRRSRRGRGTGAAAEPPPLPGRSPRGSGGCEVVVGRGRRSPPL